MIDAYLQIEGIKGESIDDKHKDWTEVSHVSYGVHQPRAATVSTAGGHTSGRAELQDIMFKKLADLSSPLLLQMCCRQNETTRDNENFMLSRTRTSQTSTLICRNLTNLPRI